MYVNDDSLVQAWQDFEVEEVNVTVLLTDVTGIYEEHVIGDQLLECPEFDVLYLALSKANILLGSQLAKLVVWVGLHTRHV
jgi:hypothetical protein